ncbi:MAG TPA: hypothetical protein VFS29_10640 [Motilibacteraceae bacterium]|nr:hypothetical protein [Motilibacteraceae bacterium]
MRRIAAAVGLAVAAAGLAAVPAVQASGATAPSSSASTTVVRPWTLGIGLEGTAVTMPSRLRAGTYIVHATTTDRVNEVQFVRPPQTLSTSRFVTLWRTWWNHQTDRNWHAWRTSATFVGGAQVVPNSLPGLPRTPAGQGTFAITLRPGTYWVYTGDLGDLRTSSGTLVPASRIKAVTVYGPAPAQSTVRYAGTVRFGSYTTSDGRPTSVSLPRTLPAQGYLRGVGTPGYVSTLGLQKLKPTTTEDMLVPGICYPDGGGLQRDYGCFEGSYQLGGAVSAGANAVWYYALPPGRYAAGQNSHNALWDYDMGRPGPMGAVSVVTVP